MIPYVGVVQNTKWRPVEETRPISSFFRPTAQLIFDEDSCWGSLQQNWLKIGTSWPEAFLEQLLMFPSDFFGGYCSFWIRWQNSNATVWPKWPTQPRLWGLEKLFLVVVWPYLRKATLPRSHFWSPWINQWRRSKQSKINLVYGPITRSPFIDMHQFGCIKCQFSVTFESFYCGTERKKRVFFLNTEQPPHERA